MRNRIPPPILTAICVGLIFAAHTYIPSKTPKLLMFNLISGVFSIAGFAILLWAGVLFKVKKTTVNPFRPNATRSIVAIGPFQFTRNPMYLGMLFVIVGAGFWWEHWLSIPIAIIFYVYMTAAQIKPEEEALAKKFGSQYIAYMQNVRRWL